MSLNDMIYKRLSVRKYTSEILSEAAIYKINMFLANSKRLYPDIKIHMEGKYQMSAAMDSESGGGILQ